MARLYITYSSRDRHLALQLAAQLRDYGHQIAIDPLSRTLIELRSL